MFDFVVPRFTKRQKAGEVFFNPMSKSKLAVVNNVSGYAKETKAVTCTTVGQPNYGKKWQFRSVGSVGNYCVPCIGYGSGDATIPFEHYALTPADILKCQQEASTECLSMEGRSDSDLWESIAEYEQVLGMLRMKLSEVGRKASELLRSARNFQTQRFLLQNISAGYLMKRYGIDPLIRDIQNILEGLTKETASKKRKTYRAKSQSTSTAVSTGYTDFDGFRVNWSLTTVDSVYCRAMSLVEIGVGILHNIGFSLKGLLTVPYELTRYSFVADWFFNLGSYIGAQVPPFEYRRLGAQLVTRRVTVNTYSITGVVNIPADIVLLQPPTGTYTVIRDETTRSELTPAAFLMKRDFKFDSFTRAADAAALVATRFVSLGRLTDTSNLPKLTYRQRQNFDLWSRYNLGR